MTTSDDLTTRRVYTPKPITLARAVGFGVLDLMGGGWNTIISGLMLYFFTTYGNVTAVEAGTILFIARIVDAVASLLIGPLTDNFYRTRLGRRFGRRHFFLLAGIPALLVVFPLLWISHQGFWYYLGVYLLVEIVMAVILIPWETLPTEMSDDYTARTKLSSARMFLSALGTFLVFFIPARIKATDNPDAYLITGLIFSVLFAAAVAITYFTTWERPLTREFVAELDAKPRLTPMAALRQNLADFGSTLRNSSFRKHLAVYLLSFTGKDVFASALTFFVVYALNGTESFGLTLQALSIVGLPVTVAAGFLMVRKGPRFLWATSFSIISACLLSIGAIYLIQPTSVITLMVIVGVCYQAGRSILEFTPWNVFPFIPDVDRIMTREDRSGIYAAVMTFGRKSTGAVSTLLVSWLLDLGGFLKPGSAGGVQLDLACTDSCPLVQSSGAQHAIAAVTVLLPMALIVAAFVCSRFVYLNSGTHAVLRAEIDRLQSGGAKADVDPETRTVVQQLTGQDYDSLWPETAVHV
jgi:oligogalacturonide transporter